MKTPTRLFKLIAGIALLATLATTSGCILFILGAGAGAGSVAYLSGELKSVVDGNIEHAIQATNAAIQQLSFVKVSEGRDGPADRIVARDAGDKKIEITLEDAGDKLTKVEIRFGVFGDQAMSQAILDKIKANL